FARARLVDGQIAPAVLLAVELLDGALAVFLRSHLDEAEAARAARLAVGHDRSGLHFARLAEQLLQVFARGLEIQVADEKSNGHNGQNPHPAGRAREEKLGCFWASADGGSEVADSDARVEIKLLPVI